MACLFCKIAKAEIPAKILYQDELVVAFEDINPQAKHHLVFIPIKHIATLNELELEDNVIIGHMLQTIAQTAKKLNFAQDGYRVVFNCNTNGGQTVFHLHAHLLGGRVMHWPPG